MSRLTSSRRRGRDRGAVAALVAVLLAGNVLLGFAALVVDVGLLYVEREELQSGADAAAVAVAKVCAVDLAACTKSAMKTKAVSYAKKNAKDGAAGATVCGRVLPRRPPVTNQLDECPGPAAPTNLTACIGDAPPDPEPYVEVRTSTARPDGTTILPPAFAGAVTGTTGTTVGACSRVSWGPVTSLTLSPTMTMAFCHFKRVTDDGVRYQSRPTDPHQHGFTDPRFEVVYHFHDASDSGCTSRTGQDITDGFGWLSASRFEDCSGTVRVGEWYSLIEDPDRRTPRRCVPVLEEAYENSTPITVALIDDANTPEFEGQVHVVGFAQFVITGWWTYDFWLNGPYEDHESDIQHKHLLGVDGCSIEKMCLYGYFTTKLVPSGTGPLGDPIFGTYYIRTIG